MPHTISPSSSMLRLGSQAGDTRVSYCKLPGHERDEIEGACYQCAETFCKQCMEAHKDHTVIFFKDCYIKNNYDWFQQIPIDIQSEPSSNHAQQREGMPPYLGTKQGSKSPLAETIGTVANKTKSITRGGLADNVASMTEEPTDDILLFTSTANHLNLAQQMQPRLQPDAAKKLLPKIEAFVARDKYSQALLFIKKFINFKSVSIDYRETVMAQIHKTIQLQAEDEQCTVRINKYLIVDNNLYVVMQHCQQSIRGLLRSQRALQSTDYSALPAVPNPNTG